MSIKDLFENTGVPKIQKQASSNEMVEHVESKEYVEAKRTEHEQFIPPIDFLTHQTLLSLDLLSYITKKLLKESTSIIHMMGRWLKKQSSTTPLLI